jgi:DNA-directed RNA polymerase subunit alpha
MTIQLNCIKTLIDENKNISSSFIIEPLESGQGITLGNTLRRALLSDLSGFAITATRINNIKHEFAIIEGLREDVVELLLNLLDIVFKPSLILKKNIILNKKEAPLKFKGFIEVKGPTILTAGMFHLPKNSLTILNPQQYIATLFSPTNFYLEVDIQNGKGYKLAKEQFQKELNEPFNFEPKTLFLDCNFNPIKKVNFKVKLIHDLVGNIKESLYIEITSNGSVSPKRSLQEILKNLVNLFSSLLTMPNFFN